MLSNKLIAASPHAARAGTGRRILWELSVAFAALTTGSRAIPLGDNGKLIRDLAARVSRAEDPGVTTCGINSVSQ
jgi:hypothetical protein